MLPYNSQKWDLCDLLHYGCVAQLFPGMKFRGLSLSKIKNFVFLDMNSLENQNNIKKYSDYTTDLYLRLHVKLC